MADTTDSKSVGSNPVRVQVPLAALKSKFYKQLVYCCQSLFYDSVINGMWPNLVRHVVRDHEIAGSNPVIPT